MLKLKKNPPTIAGLIVFFRSRAKCIKTGENKDNLYLVKFLIPGGNYIRFVRIIDKPPEPEVVRPKTDSSIETFLFITTKPRRIS